MAALLHVWPVFRSVDQDRLRAVAIFRVAFWMWKVLVLRSVGPMRGQDLAFDLNHPRCTLRRRPTTAHRHGPLMFQARQSQLLRQLNRICRRLC
jgi:hypothetical protein